MADIKTIVVPCDGSEHTARAARYAALLAKATDAPVHLVHVCSPLPTEMFGMQYPTAATVGLDPKAQESYRKMQEKAAAEAFDVARDALDNASLTVETATRTGDPATEIIDYAGTLKDPLVVIGRRGLGRFRAAMLGSVSERVMHHAGCPVMVVN